VTLKAKKKEAKEIAERINQVKKQIDEVKKNLDEKQKKRIDDGTLCLSEGSEIIDQTELDQITHLKELREEYKSASGALKPLRSDIEYCIKLTDQCRQKLMADFEQWYETCYGLQLNAQNKDNDVN
jgi:kinesin family protein 6/9